MKNRRDVPLGETCHCSLSSQGTVETNAGQQVMPFDGCWLRRHKDSDNGYGASWCPGCGILPPLASLCFLYDEDGVVSGAASIQVSVTEHQARCLGKVSRILLFLPAELA